MSEEIARIIDPEAFRTAEEWAAIERPTLAGNDLDERAERLGHRYHGKCALRREQAITKARSILSRLAGGPADAEEKPSTPSRAELLALAERLEDRSRMWAQFMRDEREAGDVALSGRSECWMMGLGFAAAELRKLLAASPSPPPPAGEDMSVEPSQQFADPGKMVGSHASYTTPPPAAGWTEETLKPIRERERNLTEWLRDNSPFCVTDQKHLDEGSAERAYWHYGYMVALRGVLKRLDLATLAPPPSGWQPIESAPKDGTTVDLWMEAGYRVADAHWGESDDDDESDFAWFNEHGDWIEGEDNRATHWLPRPPPPSGRE